VKDSMTEQTSYLGAFEEINRGIARGWVLNPVDRNQKAIVELYCDGYILGFERADVARPDLRRSHADLIPVEDVCFGFEIYVPPQALEEGKHFWVCIANRTQKFHLDKANLQDHSKNMPVGEVTAYSGLGLSGWLHPQNDDGTPAQIIVREGETELLRFTPDEPLPTEAQIRKSPLIRTFRKRLPLSLADGKAHHLDVETEDGKTLNGSPVTVAAWMTGPQSLVRGLEEQAQEHPALQQSIATLDTALKRATFLQPSSAAFEDYPAWQARFGAKPLPDVPSDFTVILYGPEPNADAAEATRASVEAQNATVTLCEVGEDINRLSWPDTGYVAFLRDGDQLHPNALVHMARSLKTYPVAYSDCDQEVDGILQPWFKPDWDPYLFISQGYVFGLLAARAEAWRTKNVASLEELVTQLLDTAHPKVGHTDQVLYHQLKAPAFGAAPVNYGKFTKSLFSFSFAKNLAEEPLFFPIQNWLNKLTWATTEALPKVSILIPTRNYADLLKTAINSIQKLTDYPEYEIIVIDNNSHEEETLAYFEDCRAQGIQILPYPGTFNFSAINNAAVAAASGEVVCLLNNDVEVTDANWLTELVRALQMPGVGIVGAKLLWENGIVQHGGVILGIDGGAAHIGNTWSNEDMGYAGLNHVFRQSTCVTAACMVVRKADYEELGGLDQHAFPVTFNDVDFCLRMRESGKAVLWSPRAKLIHAESASRGQDNILAEKRARAMRELNNLRRRWGDVLLHDPFYNRNLNRDRAPYEGLALPPHRYFSEDSND